MFLNDYGYSISIWIDGGFLIDSEFICRIPYTMFTKSNVMKYLSEGYREDSLLIYVFKHGYIIDSPELVSQVWKIIKE